MTNLVYIATSLDGYIAAPDGNLDWLDYVPAPEGDDLGFGDFISRVDAVAMGRHTFETVIGFDVGWPYPVPGLILSSTLTSAPEALADHVSFASGTPEEVMSVARSCGYEHLYVDGGVTVQRFLEADLIDELIITQIPLLLGGGDPLFSTLATRMDFELVSSEVLAGQLVKNRYRRVRAD